MSLYAVLAWWCFLGAIATTCYCVIARRAESRADAWEQHVATLITDSEDPS